MPKIIVTLEIDGDADEALHVVNKVLDAGDFQDAINEHECDVGTLHVVSALATSVTTDAEEPVVSLQFCSSGPETPCTPSCPGWTFSSYEPLSAGGDIQQRVLRCEDCDHFEDDEEARAHVEECEDCQGFLGDCVGAMKGAKQ